MNAQKFTQKSLGAVQLAQDIALERGNMQIEPAHLLAALVEQENGLIPQLLTKMGLDPGAFARDVKALVAGIPAVSGSGREPGKVYVSRETDRCLIEAENQAAGMKDDFVSVEHLFLALLAGNDPGVKRLLDRYGITQEKFLSALVTIRGNQRVTTDSPEDTYDALKKYGQDLVELARNHKLDPVIGRDNEIQIGRAHV